MNTERARLLNVRVNYIHIIGLLHILNLSIRMRELFISMRE